jgi:hypothetical protein
MAKGFSTMYERSRFEVADIFRLYGEEYRSRNGMTKKQHEVMSAIENCRTAKYGYHVDVCDQCGYEEEEFNSCRDRHCPKCQAVSRRKWIKARLTQIMPVSYYHVVFAVPHLLYPVISHNKALMYDLLFSGAAQSLLAFGRDPKWLGGEIGFFGVLHTWGQTLWQHPHVHFIVAGGALTKAGRWVEPRYRSKFLFPVRALSQVFRGKFVEGLKRAYCGAGLCIPKDLEYLNCEDGFEKWIDKLVSRNWVVYCKRPFSGAEQVVRYIGRYTHRVAISNDRIIDIKDGRVEFGYKDYKSGHKQWKTMHLTASEFIRRFLCHVLPTGFHKIRHYGFLANGRCKACIARIRALLCCDGSNQAPANEPIGSVRCPECEEGILIPMIIKTRFATITSARFGFVNAVCAFDTS